ncbi:MAG: hypothetical protein HY040_25815 [Planctomycetes bacterium]|nr:hypothetical protein [Planctomycetota bacterium]
MAQRESGKQRATRIPLDYFKAANPLEKWKGLLGWAALLIPAAWLGASYVLSLARGQEPDLHASRGPVAAVHQAWNAQCSACHVPFQAISSHSFVPPLMGDATTSDQTCKACHQGPIHHVNQIEERSCASCHRDHRGSSASLTRVPDSDCTTCHKNLKDHIAKTSGTEFANVVTRFDVDHPDFRSLKSDPGKLAFNHELHLARGLPNKNAAARFTFQDIADRGGPAFQQRYMAFFKAVNATDLVQLNCQACHQLDRADFPLTEDLEREVISGVFPPRAAGAHFLPLNYENHCKACHPLEATEIRWDAKADKAQFGNAKPAKANIAIPHRLEPAAVLTVLKDYFTTQAARGQAGFLQQKAKMPLPGKTLAEQLDPELTALIDRNMKQTEIEFFTTGFQKNCALCHQFEGDGKKRKVTPPNVPLVWFEHARFDHTAHRAIDCKQCHVAATLSAKSSDVLVPNRGNCLQCHAPRGVISGKLQGGVRFDCVECHRYHNGDHPWQGLAAPKRGVEKLQSIDELIRK